MHAPWPLLDLYPQSLVLALKACGYEFSGEHLPERLEDLNPLNDVHQNVPIQNSCPIKQFMTIWGPAGEF